MSDYVRGKIGQNTTYAVDWERASRGIIDAAKVSRLPFADKDGSLVWYVYTKGTPEDAGVYTVRVPKGFAWVKTVSSPAKVLSVTANEAKVQLDAPAPQFALRFPPGTDLTGAQVLRPGYDAPTTPETGHWTREYVKLLKDLNAGVIRGMDFQRTNGSKIVGVLDPPHADSDRYGVEGFGGPPELLIELCNAVGADLWLNIPHSADDACVQWYARLCYELLSPNLAVYVEYSNEVWNTLNAIGDNTAYCKAQGVADPSCDGPNPTVKCRQFYAKRAAQVGAIFKKTFRAETHRVRPVLSGQSAYPEQLEWSVAWVTKNLGAFKDFFYGVAVAPYFGNTDDYAKRAALSVNDYYGQGYTLDGKPMPGVYLIDRATVYLRSEKGQRFFKLARDQGVKALAYEGGLGYKVTKAMAPVLAQVCADPRIADVLKAHYDEWTNQGGDVYCHFVGVAEWDSDSSYGATDRIGAFGPKAQAFAQLSAARPHPYAQDPRDEQVQALSAQVASLTEKLRAKEWDLTGVSGELQVQKERLQIMRDRVAAAVLDAKSLADKLAAA
jgi:hypothetical protein